MTNSELDILSLIAERPRHGYEIERVIEERGMRDWTEVGFSSIYYVLKKLEKNALIEGHTERQVGRGPARKVYHVTAAGKAAWRQAMPEALSVPRRCDPPLQLGLASLPGIPPADAVAALRQYRERLVERQEHVRARWESKRPLPYHVDAMFNLSLTMIEAELKWIRGFIQTLASREQTEQGGE